MAIVVPDAEVLEPWARNNGIKGDIKQLCENKVKHFFLNNTDFSKDLKKPPPTPTEIASFGSPLPSEFQLLSVKVPEFKTLGFPIPQAKFSLISGSLTWVHISDIS